MIDFYTAPTPNGHKVSCTLEALNMDYEVHVVNLMENEQKKPDFLKISPNGRIPAIIDTSNNLTIFESGAIMIYLADKANNLISTDPQKRAKVLEWLMFQMGGPGPIFGQVHHFLRAAPEPVPYAIERYGKETQRLYAVLDKQLSISQFLTDEYSIADMATYPWVARHEWHKIDLNSYPNVKRWFDELGQREAVQKGMAVPFLN